LNYQRAYDAIITKAKLRNGIDGYFEKHHIIPKCLGGSDDKANLVNLTGKEHFICHLFLHKIYPDNVDLLCSIFIMSKHCGVANSRAYERVKLELQQKLRDMRKGVNNPMFGKNAFDGKTKEEMKEIGKKLSRALRGKSRYVTYIDINGKIHRHNKGEPIPEGFKRKQQYTEQSKQKMSKSAKKRGAPAAAFRDKSGERNPTFGRKMYHDPFTRKHKYFEEGKQPYGWILGYGVDYKPRGKK